MTVEGDGPDRPAIPEADFDWDEDPEPEWVAGIRAARSRRAERLAELLGEPDSASDPEDPP